MALVLVLSKIRQLRCCLQDVYLLNSSFQEARKSGGKKLKVLSLRCWTETTCS